MLGTTDGLGAFLAEEDALGFVELALGLTIPCSSMELFAGQISPPEDIYRGLNYKLHTMDF